MHGGTITSLGIFEGMLIGAVDPVHITADTPFDPDQWDEGKPWHIKKGE